MNASLEKLKGAEFEQKLLAADDFNTSQRD